MPTLQRGLATRLTLAFLLGCPALLRADTVSSVSIDDASTSIYIGTVHLNLGTLRRSGDRVEGRYDARVVPLFFYNEAGSFNIQFSEAMRAELEAGKRVSFDGTATSTKGESRSVEGYASAKAAGAREGTIKVRIHVSKRIVLVFNTAYHY